jgi:hypothetical protein
MTLLLQEKGYFPIANIITANIFIRKNFKLYGTFGKGVHNKY